MEEKLEGWAKEKGGVKFCPVCKTKIEKNEGCNHMTCIVCSYEFCWHCLNYAGNDAEHFNPLNPDSCGIGMMASHVESRAKRICKMVVYIILIILFLPAICIFWLPIALASAACKCNCGCCCNSIMAVFGFISGFIFVPIVAPATLIFFIALAFYLPCVACKKLHGAKSRKAEREQ